MTAPNNASYTVFTAVMAFDGNEDELGFHGLWHDLMVLSNPTYDPVLVEVDGVVYSVSAALAEVVQGEEEEEDPTHRLRILARLGEDGRIEHGVELFSGFEILPERRYLPSDTTVGMWYSTQDVEFDGVSIGQIRARRLADGRVELGFRDFDGDIVAPDIAYLPADLDEGVWYRSSLIDVPMPPELPEDDEAAEAEGETEADANG